MAENPTLSAFLIKDHRIRLVLVCFMTRCRIQTHTGLAKVRPHGIGKQPLPATAAPSIGLHRAGAEASIAGSRIWIKEAFPDISTTNR